MWTTGAAPGCAAPLTVAAAVSLAAKGSVDEPEPAVIFGALIALGELFRMNMPGGREVAPMDEGHGWRIGRFADPFGHHWEIGRRL